MAFPKTALRFLTPRLLTLGVLITVVGSGVLLKWSLSTEPLPQRASVTLNLHMRTVRDSANNLEQSPPSTGHVHLPSLRPVSKVSYRRIKCEWTSLKESLSTDTSPETERNAGALNLHMWTVCGGRVQSLKQWPLFPCFPDRKTFVADATLAIRGCNTGQRVFGFLHPQSSGTFYFAITSDEASELWLSPDQHPRYARLIAQVQSRSGGVAYTSPEDFMKYPMQMSGGISLNNDQKYFVEVLHKSGKDYAGHVSVLWKPPGAKNFSVITKQFLLPFCFNNEGCPCVGDLQTPFPSHVQPPPPQPVSKEALQHYYNTPHFDQNHLKDVLTFRPYEPSYVIRNGIVKKRQGIKLVGFTLSSVYPGDTVFLNNAGHRRRKHQKYAPNKLLRKKHVDALVNQFMDAIRSKHKQRFSLESIVGVEEKIDPKEGTKRYLLDLRLHDTVEGKHVRLSEFVFVDREGQLSFPDGLNWKRNATIFLILPVKNQFNWMIFFVNEMSRIYLQTKDEYFHIVITDFESTDGDVDEVLRNSPIARKYTLLKKTGAFHKTLAIQEAVNTIKDPNSIVFLIDLHITMPLSLLDSIRRHTIQGRTAFLPVSARLGCGRSLQEPSGFWALFGSGIVGVYKSDWNRFNGTNVEEYTTKWGGEDWDLLDRILRVGLESERLKIPGFVHFYHTRSNMWENGNEPW